MFGNVIVREVRSAPGERLNTGKSRMERFRWQNDCSHRLWDRSSSPPSSPSSFLYLNQPKLTINVEVSAFARDPGRGYLFDLRERPQLLGWNLRHPSVLL